MTTKGQKVFCAALAIFLGLSAAACVFRIVSVNSVAVVASPASRKTVIIDPGHGGLDGGAVGYRSTVEKDINLAISLKLKTMLTACGYDVLMTRETDCMIGEDEVGEKASIREKKVKDIKSRVAMIQKHPEAIVLSIHQNLFSDGRYNGAQMFYSVKNEDSRILASFLQNRFVTMLQKDNARSIKEAGDNIYLMNHIDVPAVLVECGFISNGLEAANLSDDEYQNKIAFVIFAALTDYFEKDMLPENA
ncbi:MAG TPA: hypothetical protein DCE08_05210 [Ruminococcaceae bacterium]|nr:hypothetical protein [Oscillospiraceae bacterium]